MASVPPQNSSIMPHVVPTLPTVGISLPFILTIALVLRVVAAVVVQWYTERIGKPCLFGDTFIYLDLAGKIRHFAPFEVNQFGIPHYALRTPGYPFFLAVCQALFGPSFLAIRLVQAVLNIVGVYVLYRFFQNVLPSHSAKQKRSAGHIAVILAAVEPYGIGLEALLLSEGVFIPLMLVGLWGVAYLWNDHRSTSKSLTLLALGTGIIHGLAIMVRPSWALIVPCFLFTWPIFSKRDTQIQACKLASVLAIGVVVVMSPWWMRNAKVFGRFVPTALWVGASLYDGISPTANGASDMRFLAEPGIVELDETAQDVELKRQAVAFGQANPGRVVELAWVKFCRFWSPWPNADTLKSPAAAVLSSLVTIPLFVLATIGLWDRRRDFRAIVLLAGPLVYFLLLHMIFVSSIRYRIPGFLPALGLAAIGWQRVAAAISYKVGQRPIIKQG